MLGSELLFKHGDHLGSASVQTDSQGNLKQRIQYYPYGGDRFEETAEGMDGKDVKHRFTDHEKDFAIGIYYAQARYYDQRLVQKHKEIALIYLNIYPLAL